MTLCSGCVEGLPYSLSRWTDVPSNPNKWAWFQECLVRNKMVAFDPKTTAPKVWSLQPEDTLGLVFWTKNPTNLISGKKILSKYSVIVYVTATGWSEVEKGVPTIQESGDLLVQTAKVFKVRWRFSPVPLLPTPEVLHRFQNLLSYATRAHMTQVIVSFLQPNDRIPETRTPQERFDLLNTLANEARKFGIEMILCADDQSFLGWPGALFKMDACVSPEDFEGKVHLERCGCVSMTDPFTVNEACSYNCLYCYSGNKSLSSCRRDTTGSI